MLKRDNFLNKYKIPYKDYKKAKLDWNELKSIFDHFEKTKSEFKPSAIDITNRILPFNKVHSVRYRIKDSEHLIEKIIRKTINKEYKNITVKNYINKITDIIGIRALHLFKDDLFRIDSLICENYEFEETPIVYIREGESKEYFNKLIEKSYKIVTHPMGYRSVHYIVKTKPTKKTYIAELQIRTLFEEGWSEIDHSIRYPYGTNHKVLDYFLDLFNMFAGVSNDMGHFVRALNVAINKFLLQEVDYKEKIDELQEKIQELTTVDQKTKNELSDNLDDIFTSSKDYSFNFGDTIRVSDSFAYITKKTCDKCHKEIDTGNSLYGTASYYGGLNYCMSCGRNLCQECWPKFIGGIGSFLDNTICPDCRLTNPMK